MISLYSQEHKQEADVISGNEAMPGSLPERNSIPSGGADAERAREIADHYAAGRSVPTPTPEEL
jgi:hypothetical protein